MSGDDRLQRIQNFLRGQLSEAWAIEPSPRARLVVAMYTWHDGTSDTVFAMDSGYAYGHRDTATGTTVMETEGLIPRVVQVVDDWISPH